MYGSRLLPAPRSYSLHLCQPPAMGQRSPRTPTRRPATGARMGRPQGMSPKRQRNPQAAGWGGLSGWVPSGCDRKTPGTPGTNARNGAKSLPCLVFSVPGRTGDKPPNTGDTGDNSFQRSARQCRQQAAPSVSGAWCTLKRPCAARNKPPPPPPIGGPQHPGQQIKPRSQRPQGWCSYVQLEDGRRDAVAAGRPQPR